MQDEYVFTDCAKKAIDEYYPTSRDRRTFSEGQKILQIELIYCHLDSMDDETRQRALRTLRFLGA